MAIAVSALPQAAGAQPGRGADLASACTSCHGLDGHGAGTIPSIGGMDREALLGQLRAFRAQEGEATIMKRLVRGYDDAELEALAEYFSAAKGKNP
ncbi:MAG: c-type cytochrome [Sphingobium sp.]